MAGPAALAVVAVVVIVALVASGGGGPSALHYKVGTLAVYGAKGSEGIPMEVGPVLGAPNPSLPSTPVDGVQCGATEQLTVHYHAHLQIFVDGQPRSVPRYVGIGNTCLFWMHTHVQDGVIHVEAPGNRPFVLGQFFDIWGQALSPTQVGPAHGAVTVTVDGKVFAGDPIHVPITSHAQIVLNVGGPLIAPPAVDFSGTSL